MEDKLELVKQDSIESGSSNANQLKIDENEAEDVCVFFIELNPFIAFFFIFN
jgi:hypothetical protein